MMAKVDDSLYQQEVEELTEFVRTDDDWADLRNILIEKQFNIPDTLLVAFAEDEGEMEYGVLVTRGKKVFEYSRSTADGRNNASNFKTSELTDLNNAFDKHPQVKIAFKMIEEGSI